MELRITHETRYDYSPAVETAQHMAHLHPLDTPCQRLLAHRLDIAPTPAQRSQTPDVYGNLRTFFSLQSPHTVLRVVAVSEVETRAPKPAYEQCQVSASAYPPPGPPPPLHSQPDSELPRPPI